MIFEGLKKRTKTLKIFLALSEDELTCCVPELDCDIPVVHPDCFHLIMTIGDHGDDDDHGDHHDGDNCDYELACNIPVSTW